jgi:regulator of replication initiation timing
LAATRNELGTVKTELAILKEDNVKMTVYIEDLKEKIKAQDSEKTV